MSGNTVDLRYPFAEWHTLTHDKPTYMPSAKIQHSGNTHRYRVSPFDTRQTLLYAECQNLTLGKHFFLILPPQTFCTVVLQYLLLCVEVLYTDQRAIHASKYCFFLRLSTLTVIFLYDKCLLTCRCLQIGWPVKASAGGGWWTSGAPWSGRRHTPLAGSGV